MYSWVVRAGREAAQAKPAAATAGLTVADDRTIKRADKRKNPTNRRETPFVHSRDGFRAQSHRCESCRARPVACRALAQGGKEPRLLPAVHQTRRAGASAR